MISTIIAIYTYFNIVIMVRQPIARKGVCGPDQIMVNYIGQFNNV